MYMCVYVYICMYTSYTHINHPNNKLILVIMIIIMGMHIRTPSIPQNMLVRPRTRQASRPASPQIKPPRPVSTTAAIITVNIITICISITITTITHMTTY